MVRYDGLSPVVGLGVGMPYHYRGRGDRFPLVRQQDQPLGARGHSQIPTSSNPTLVNMS